MNISQATPDDIDGLAKLVWLDTCDEEPNQWALDAFAAELASWWNPRRNTHLAFVARLPTAEIIGMAWIALVSRVPRPSLTNRLAADIQTVFVLPKHRGHGLGSTLVDAAAEQATKLGAARVTVRSGRTALPMYERLGFQSSRQLLER